MDLTSLVAANLPVRRPAAPRGLRRLGAIAATTAGVILILAGLAPL